MGNLISKMITFGICSVPYLFSRILRFVSTLSCSFSLIGSVMTLIEYALLCWDFTHVSLLTIRADMVSRFLVDLFFTSSTPTPEHT